MKKWKKKARWREKLRFESDTGGKVFQMLAGWLAGWMDGWMDGCGLGGSVIDDGTQI